MPYLKKPKKITLPYRYCGRKVPPGQFSSIQYGVANSWESCRETFFDDSTRYRTLLFSHRGSVGPNVAAFFSKIERRLKVQPKTIFAATKRPNITWVKMSPWWATGCARISLFTALLRAAQNYTPVDNNFEDALFGDYKRDNIYIRQTEAAVRRFLAGYVRFVGNFTDCDTPMWRDRFRYNTEKTANKYLAKPKP